SCEREHNRTSRAGMNRLRDKSRAVAQVERAGQRGLGLDKLTAVAQRHREAEQRVERNLRPSELLGQFVSLGEQLGRGVEVALTPAQQAAERVGQAQFAHQALALRELGAGVCGPRDLFPVTAVERKL